jgi:hypothetical protein
LELATEEKDERKGMRLILAAPDPEDIIRLLKAWRFWLLGAVAGALIGAAVSLVAPQQYRARATVNVDFHLEEAWPESSDREQFYYLERETRKLEEIAMSDAVLKAVGSQAGGVDLKALRGGKLQLSQPGNGGWHFYAYDRDAGTAQRLASAWAQEFAMQVQAQVAQPSSGLEQYITAQPTQIERPDVQRAVSMSETMLAGALLFLAVTGLGLLFVRRTA